MASQTSLAVRIDKWLWAARFFKTRSLATEAIDAGHVRRGSTGSISGERVKPALIVRVGDTLAIQRGDALQEIVVTAISDRRGNATEASALYTETEQSVKARLDRQALRSVNHGVPIMRGRPTKQDRRKLAELFASTYPEHSDRNTQ
jgi:ribosome-associated heat shock protein Hsp15